MHEIHDGPGFRFHDDYGITLSSVGQRLMVVFSWVHCGSTGLLSLALTVSEFRTIFFVSWQHVYLFDCFSVVIDWIRKEASSRS